MSKKQMIITIVLVTVVLLIGIGGYFYTKQSNKETMQVEESTGYELVKETYIKKEGGYDIKIEYPQIKKLNDIDKEKTINEILKEDAMAEYNFFTKDIVLGKDQQYTQDIGYVVKFNNNKYLSVFYNGYVNLSSAVHPSNFVQATNIDIDKGKKLKLSDLIAVNDELILKLKSGKSFIENEEITKDKMVEMGIKNITDLFLFDLDVEQLNSTEKWYFTDNLIGISVDIAYVVGSHMEIEINR